MGAQTGLKHSGGNGAVLGVQLGVTQKMALKETHKKHIVMVSIG